MTNIAISSGHGKYVSGAVDILDEHKEAVRVVNKVAEFLGSGVKTFEDTTSKTQNENLHTIVNWHNKQTRDLDVSVHFNCYEHTSKAMGTECLYYSQDKMASQVADAVSEAGKLIDRGAKRRTDLYFLNNTTKPAILIEICFVDSEADVKAYNANFDSICKSVAATISGQSVTPVPPTPEPDPGELFSAKGKCSHFGGPDDTGVSASEGLAFLYNYDDAPHLFLPNQPPGTTGLARRLNPDIFYVACRWDYDVTSKAALGNPSRQAIVRAKGREFLAWPADWGPHQDTGRVADLSPGLMEALGLTTDDEVQVVYPAPA